MKEVLRLNPISPLIDKVFGDKYKLVAESEAPVGILVRSFKMHEYEPAKSVLCVGRAGAGVNNIPCDKYAETDIALGHTYSQCILILVFHHNAFDDRLSSDSTETAIFFCHFN